MKKYCLISYRKIYKTASRQLVYEWEDILNSFFNSEIIFITRLNRYIIKLFQILGISFDIDDKKQYILLYNMTTIPEYYNKCNVIPIIIDFFLSKDEIKNFESLYKKSKCVIITSKEAFDWLIDNNCSLNIKHWPLSLPDKYKLNKSEVYHKEYDFVLVGRQNVVLLDYLKRYERTHNDIIYVIEGKEKFHYYTNKGLFIGVYKNRLDYINLIKKAKMALYSTPSMDNSRIDTNGFNQVTPKFLEYIAAQCHVLMRYPINSDTQYFELPKFGPSITTYEQFEELVDKYINKKVDIIKYSDYLSKHYTSVRSRELFNLLQNL